MGKAVQPMHRRLVVLLFLVALPLAALPAVPAAPPTQAETFLVAFDAAPAQRPGDTYGGARVEQTIDGLRMLVVSTTDGRGLQQRAAHDPNVRYVEAERDDWKLFFTPNDYYYGHAAHWGSKRIGAEAAWDVTLGATAIKIAMVDSGLNKAHEEFAGQVRVLQGHDFMNGDNDPDDSRGCDYHGTHTTGTAAATINNGKGIAGMSQSTILPVKIFAKGFGGCGTTTSAIVNALKYAGDQGAHLSSNSWGGGGSSSAINDAIAYAHGKGTIHVAAAGNSGPCTYCVGQPWRDNPDKTIVVSALARGDKFASFSSQGAQVDVIAPGEHIASATSGTNGYSAYSGTSMAAPHVTGALALYMTAHATYDHATVEATLRSTAEDLGFSSARQGAGLVRADRLTAGGTSGEGGNGTTNSAPTASFTYTCTELVCGFDGTGSSDFDGDTLSHSWDFGDGATGTGATPSHTYASGGTYTVTLIVSDGNTTGTATRDVTVSTSTSGSTFTLGVSPYKVRGWQFVDLTWSGTNATTIDVLRDGTRIATVANTGSHTDDVGKKGGGSYTYQVCASGTTECSNSATATF